MQIKPRNEYVIAKRMGFGFGPRNSGVGLEPKLTYFMERRYVMDRHIKDREQNQALFKSDYVATGLSYKQAKQMMKLFKEN